MQVAAHSHVELAPTLQASADSRPVMPPKVRALRAAVRHAAPQSSPQMIAALTSKQLANFLESIPAFQQRHARLPATYELLLEVASAQQMQRIRHLDQHSNRPQAPRSADPRASSHSTF